MERERGERRSRGSEFKLQAVFRERAGMWLSVGMKML